MIAKAHLRVARPTNNLTALMPFYVDGLGFKEVGRFADHAGFDGIMLGHPGAGYHLEFTQQTGHDAGRAPTKDNLLVFYLPDEEAWVAAVQRMERVVGQAVTSANPYWDKVGKTWEDRDGYRVVLAKMAWENVTTEEPAQAK